MVEVSSSSDPQNHLKVLVYLNTSEPQSKSSGTFKDLFASQEVSESEDLPFSNESSKFRLGANHERDFQLLEVEIESFTLKMLY